jgi:ribosomal protein L16/L10AE
VNSKVALNKGRECSFGQMGRFTMETLKAITAMALECCTILMARDLKVTGRMELSMGRAIIFSLMVRFTV